MIHFVSDISIYPTGGNDGTFGVRLHADEVYSATVREDGGLAYPKYWERTNRMGYNILTRNQEKIKEAIFIYKLK